MSDEFLMRQSHTVMMSNIGYARDIDGSLAAHIVKSYRHLWCPPSVQRRVLRQVKETILQQQADICCMLEVETGRPSLLATNQHQLLMDEEYCFGDAENKYLESSRLRQFPFTYGKSNGFIARRDYAYQKLFFRRGTKRLIYRVQLEEGVSLYFTHFSLNAHVRKDQLAELFDLADQSPDDVILMGDFNILGGLDEVIPLLAARDMTLLNQPDISTFIFHHQHMLLDLCICSDALLPRAKLEVIPQDYSDHAALVLRLSAEA
jgi:endonuclease/exonuclease/phosphatase family metal-dependent hydrolase